jgi:hypothetical protein
MAPPELRDAAVRGLQDWLGRQRRFEPGVMAELVDLIKRPMDQYAAAWAWQDGEGRRWRRPYASCVVVGNSGVLLAREHGARSSTATTW